MSTTRSKARQEIKSLRLYFIDQHQKLGQTLVGVYNNVPKWMDEVFVSAFMQRVLDVVRPKTDFCYRMLHEHVDTMRNFSSSKFWCTRQSTDNELSEAMVINQDPLRARLKEFELHSKSPQAVHQVMERLAGEVHRYTEVLLHLGVYNAGLTMSDLRSAFGKYYIWGKLLKPPLTVASWIIRATCVGHRKLQTQREPDDKDMWYS